MYSWLYYGLVCIDSNSGTHAYMNLVIKFYKLCAVRNAVHCRVSYSAGVLLAAASLLDEHARRRGRVERTLQE